MKPVIICIVGASGSGKTLASMILKEQRKWNAIVSYTTRPMRNGEVNGLDHWFVAQDKMPDKERMCAYTQFGGYEYWTTWDQFSKNIPNVYVIDEKGLIDLQDKKASPSPFQLFTIKLRRNHLQSISEERKRRDKERIHIPNDAYDYIIDNNGSLERLRTTLYLTSQCIIQKIEDNGSTANR